MKYDLHVHSNISDGVLNRIQIVKLAEQLGIRYLAFTEHNTFSDYYPKSKDVYFVKGIEFDCKTTTSFHALCYFLNYHFEIENMIKKYQKNINNTSEELISNIEKIFDIPISIDLLKGFFQKESISKRDIIDWLLVNKYASSVKQAADTFTNRNSLSYVPKYSLDFKEVSDCIHKLGGIIVLAHPNTLEPKVDNMSLFIKNLKNDGLDGIEVINTSKKLINTGDYCGIAEKYDLLTTGGSDFHNPNTDKLGIIGDYDNTIIKRIRELRADSN